MMHDAVLLWYSLCEAVDQLQQEGITFQAHPDYLMDKWHNTNLQERVKSEVNEDGITIKIEKETIKNSEASTANEKRKKKNDNKK